jgi:hypothetical protein
MLTSEPSYFNFLMKRRSHCRTRVPFAQAAGAIPDVKRRLRTRRPERMPTVFANETIPAFSEDVTPNV